MTAVRSLFWNREGRIRAGWKVAVFLLLHGLALAWLGLGLRSVGLRSPLVWYAAAAGVVFILSILFLAGEGRPLASLGGRLDGRWLLELLAGGLGGVLLMGLTALTVWGLGGHHWVWGGGGTASLLSGAGLFAAVAVREELLFRGYAFQRLTEGMGPWPTLLLTAGYFAYAHWGNPGMAGTTKLWASLNIGLAGVLLGLAWLRTRQLAMPIGIHFGWNWAQGSLMGFGVSGTTSGSLLMPVLHDGPAWLSGGPFGLEASLPCAVVTLLAIAGLAWWHPRRTT